MLKLARPLPPLARLPREMRDTLFLLAVIAWVLLLQLPYLPGWSSALGLALLLGRGWLALQQRALPHPVWRGALLLLILVATWLQYGTLLGQQAGVTLVLLLLALKTLELRAQRDALVVFFLGFFTLLSQFFHSQSLLTALAMLIALWGLLTALVNAQLPVGQPPLALAARIAARLMLLGTPLMLLLFLFFPRLGPLWNLPADALGARSGLSERMQVGQIARLARSKTEIPSRSLGIRSEVNCTRENSRPKLRASACASVVLPTPGMSSISRWPPASRQVTQSLTCKDLPAITVLS